MSGKSITDKGLQTLGNWKKLESVSVFSSGISDAGIKALAGLTSLKTLRIGESKHVSDESVECLLALTQLEHLQFFGGNFTDVGVKKCCSLRKLKTLYLISPAITGEAVQELRDLLPHCEVLTALQAVR